MVSEVDLVLQVDYCQEAFIHNGKDRVKPSRVRKSNFDVVVPQSSVSLFVVPHTVHFSAQVSFHHLVLAVIETVVLGK